MVPGIAVIALYVPQQLMVPVLVLGLVATITLWLVGIADAWREARRRIHFQLRAWQTSGLYAAVFVVCNLLILPLLIDWVRNHQVRAFKIPSASMAPTLLQGDYLFADMRYNCPGCAMAVARGDVAIFVYPNNRNRYYIKRILALPGDTVRIDGNRVSINDTPLSEPQANDMQPTATTRRADSRAYRSY